MKIDTINQFSVDSGQSYYDLVVVASGYESRARYLVENYELEFTTGVAFQFEEHKEYPERKHNNKAFENRGFEAILIEGGDSAKCHGIFSSYLNTLESGARVLIDFSCMTRAWIAGIVRALFDIEDLRSLDANFFYAGAEYTPITETYPSNEVAAPIQGFSALALPNRPAILVLGLGQDTGRATGLREYIDPEETVLFFPSPSIDEKFELDVAKNNEDVIRKHCGGNYISYPVMFPEEAFKKLESVVLGLKRHGAVVLCSFGPKIFNLYCLLLAAHYKDMSVWRVSAGARETPIDRKASGKTVIFSVKFVSN